MLNIRTRIRTHQNLSKRIRFRIRSENIRTVFIPRRPQRPVPNRLHRNHKCIFFYKFHSYAAGAIRTRECSRGRPQRPVPTCLHQNPQRPVPTCLHQNSKLIFFFANFVAIRLVGFEPMTSLSHVFLPKHFTTLSLVSKLYFDSSYIIPNNV